MDELEQIRKQKLAAMQQEMSNNQNNQIQQHAEMQQQMEMLEGVIKQHLSSEALVRFGTIKLAHPEKAVQVMVIIAQLLKSGKIPNNQKISDEQFKELLRMMTPEKKEFTIKRK
jgi:programmed cell death protein 5